MTRIASRLRGGATAHRGRAPAGRRVALRRSRGRRRLDARRAARPHRLREPRSPPTRARSGRRTRRWPLPTTRRASLPAVVTSQLASVNAGSGSSFTTNGWTATRSPSARRLASALPRIGADAELLDLDLLSNVQTGPTDPGLTDEVWLGPRAPRDAVARLRAAGLNPTTVERSATVFTQLQRSGPALADDFLLVATLAALLVAAASTLGSLGATTRERATELTSLEVAGVPRPTLVASLGLESGDPSAHRLMRGRRRDHRRAAGDPLAARAHLEHARPAALHLPGGPIAVVAVVVLLLVAARGRRRRGDPRPPHDPDPAAHRPRRCRRLTRSSRTGARAPRSCARASCTSTRARTRRSWRCATSSCTSAPARCSP